MFIRDKRYHEMEAVCARSGVSTLAQEARAKAGAGLVFKDEAFAEFE